MELRLNRESAVSVYDALDTELTQAAEHDFILPDYCADIFRVLKCCVIPSVTSSGLSGGRLSFDLNVILRVIYRSESGGICCVEHTQVYTRSADVPDDLIDPCVKITPGTGSLNCRVVDKRRLEVRSNISCRVKVTAAKKCEVLSGAYGGGIQLKSQPVVYPAKRLTAAKRITVIEELELAEGKPEFGSVLRCAVAIGGGDGKAQVQTKIIPGKLITKGEAAVTLLYLPKGTDTAPELMRFNIPFSQIIDIDGLEEDFEAQADVEAASCIVTPKSDGEGLLECELILTVNVTALKFVNNELVTDAYSTRCEINCEKINSLAGAPGKNLRLDASAKCSLGSADGNTSQVYDLWCEDPTVFSRFDENSMQGLIYGKITFCMLGRLSDGTPAYAEKEVAFERSVPLTAQELDGAKVKAAVTGCSYTLGDDGTVQGKAELEFSVTASSSQNVGIISSITLDTEHPKVRDSRCAVRICYSETGDCLWDIAKKYSTEAHAIADENPAGSRVLIIPMKN